MSFLISYIIKKKIKIGTYTWDPIFSWQAAVTSQLECCVVKSFFIVHVKTMPQGIKTCWNLKDQVLVLQVLRQDSKGRGSCVYSYRKCAMTEDTGAVGRLILMPTRYWVWCCSLWHGPPTPLRALLWLSTDGANRAQPQGLALRQQECSCPSWAQHRYSLFHLNTGLVHRWWSISSPRDLSLWWWVHRYLVPRMQLCPRQGVGRLFKSIQISHAAQHSFYVIKWWKFSTKTKWVLMYRLRSHVWNHFMTSSLPALSGRVRAEATRHSEALSTGRQRYRQPRPPLLVRMPVSPTEEQYHHHSPCPALLQARTCAAPVPSQLCQLSLGPEQLLQQPRHFCGNTSRTMRPSSSSHHCFHTEEKAFIWWMQMAPAGTCRGTLQYSQGRLAREQ